MSGLEKFQADKAWRAKVKKLLFMQRNLAPPTSAPVQCQRFSLDIAEDLQVILEEKTVSREANIPDSTEKMFKGENEKNKPNNKNTASHCISAMNSNTKSFFTRDYYNETMCEDLQRTVQWQRSSDESFMALEKMCDKTASDPNSTLFRYMHSEDKELVVEDAKKRSADGNLFKTPCKQELQEIDEEAKSLQRLLNDLCVQEQKQLENETSYKGIDVTLLEDIEAPSKLWDATIVGDTTLQTSPVKMVGLLRPSTILEECAEDEFNNSLSFQSAVKGSETSRTTTTSYYETAHDSTGASGRSKESHIAHHNNSDHFDKSLELINLDTTLEARQKNADSEIAPKMSNNTEKESPSSSFNDTVGVIELLSDDELDEVKVDLQTNSETDNNFAKHDNTDLATSNTPMKQVLAEKNDCSLSVEQSNSLINLPNNLDIEKENYAVFHDSGDEQSLHFNDTMEEVEYMMKKGMQYMTESPNPGFVLKEIQIAQPSMIVKPLQEKERTFTFSPKKQTSIRSSPSPTKRGKVGKPTAIVTGTKAKTTFSSPRRTPQTSAQKAKYFVMDMKPVPKLELFKKPNSGIPTRLKEQAGPKQFSHIVSPIGAYMKQTATTPLMANLKQRTERPIVRNASVFRELEKETKVYQPKFGLTGNTGTKHSSLPKKAYISSEFKHIVDERTPVTIPGGKKIQKYLENAMLPTVVRHEGKLKMSTQEASRKSVAQKASFGTTSQRNNGSLANLSLMSGDISLYTMKDARKF